MCTSEKPAKERQSQKLKIELSYDLAITLVGIYPKDTKIQIRRGTCTPVFIVTLSIAKLWRKPKCPLTDKWMKKTWYIYSIEYYSVIKKNEILSFATTWMELECITLMEISQSEKYKYHITSHMGNLRNKTDEGHRDASVG